MYFCGYRGMLCMCVGASILTPILIFFAAHGLIESVVVLGAVSFSLCYGCNLVKKLNRTVSFFFIWFITSIIYILLNFEFIVSSYLMMSSGENFAFLSLILLGLYCLIFSKCSSSQSCQPLNPVKGDALSQSIDKNLDDESKKWTNLTPDACPLFARIPFWKGVRCCFCRVLIQPKQQYCLWLDCYISVKNFDFYILGLVFLASGLMLYMYLIVISACHCHLLLSVFGMDIYVPDDCHDVYYDSFIANCFASGLYAILLAVIALHSLFTDVVFFHKTSPTTLNKSGFYTRLLPA